MYEWIHDDITWCGNECSHTECERNLANKLSHEGMFSMALFRNTETCPLYNKDEKNKMKIIKKGNVIKFKCNCCDCEFAAGIHVVESNDGNYYANCPMCGDECHTDIAKLQAKRREENEVK